MVGPVPGMSAHRLPMMVPRRVVTVMQAETLLVPKRESEAASRALDQLEALFKEPEPQTTLVLVASTVDKRSRMYRILQKHATIVDCGVLADLADAERWVRTRVAAGGAAIDPPAARLIAQRAGTDIKRLRADVERLVGDMEKELARRRSPPDDVLSRARPPSEIANPGPFLPGAVSPAPPSSALRPRPLYRRWWLWTAVGGALAAAAVATGIAVAEWPPGDAAVPPTTAGAATVRFP